MREATIYQELMVMSRELFCYWILKVQLPTIGSNSRILLYGSLYLLLFSHHAIYLFVCVWSLIVHLDLDC